MTELERSYLRLLRCYPPSHRQAHQEEMLGILLATARPGQRTPRLSQAVNLAACGLAIRARRALAAGSWPDALAVVSLVAPVLMAVMSALALAWSFREVVMRPHGFPPTAASLFSPSTLVQLAGPAAVTACWLTVVVLALTGRRQAAAAIAAVPLALDLTNELALLLQRTGVWSGQLSGFVFMTGVGPVVLASLAVCSLACSAGPRRALALVGPRRAALMLAIIAIGAGLPPLFDVVSPVLLLPGPLYSLLSFLALAAALAVTRVRGLAGGRVLLLVAIAFVVDRDSYTGTLTSELAALLGTLLLSLLAWLPALASYRMRRGLS